jgi:septum formation protein
MSGRLVLASGSARRRDLLSVVGIDVDVDPSEAPEDLPRGTTAADGVLLLARRKAADVAARHPGRIVLAADTLVEIDGTILGKPADAADARRMLQLLSGRTHRVVTGVVLVRADGSTDERSAETRVRMARLTEAEITAYTEGPEPYDKAGAYGIQGAAGWFVASIEGSFSNVMGLPLEQVRELLTEAGTAVPRLGSGSG